MKLKIFRVLFYALPFTLYSLLFTLYPSSAGVPERITYQGTLRKDGAIYTGTVSMQFEITNQDGSIIYWASGSTDVYVSAGLFRYPLGTPNEPQFQAIKWYEIDPYVKVTIEGVSLPKDPLFASPYSLHSKTSHASFGNFTVTNGNILISTTTGVGGIIFQDGSYQITAAGSGVWGTYSPNIYWTGSGSVGIGTSAPSYKLDVLGVIRSTDSAYFATSQGNVGIGTTGPNMKLEVTGNVLATGFQGDGSGLTNITASTITPGSFANGAYTFPNNLTILGSLGAELNAGNFKITNLADPSASQDAATMNYVNSLTGGGQNAAVLSATQTFSGLNTFINQISISSNLFVLQGNVGISTSAPVVRLAVEGGIIATSSITAQSFYGDGTNLTGVSGSALTNTVDVIITADSDNN
ncbi:MAG: hypothetical protein AB1633_12515, partial [Elusimicrobiota bacterium]